MRTVVRQDMSTQDTTVRYRSGMSISKNARAKSRKLPRIDEESALQDHQLPWPLNPEGYVVPQKQIEEFISNQALIKAQITAKRFMVVADAARAISRGEDPDLNWRLIRYTADLDKADGYQSMMGAMIAAIEKGEQGIKAACGTTCYMLEYGFEYTACCNREKLHQDTLRRLSRTGKLRLVN